jgi:hypothetical protein
MIRRPAINLALIGLFSLVSTLAMAMGTPPQTVQTAERASGTASVMLRDDDLRASPDAASKVSGRFAKGMSVRILASQGGWTQVTGNGQTGWVRVLSVRAASSGQAGAGLAGLVEAGTTTRDPGNVVAVAGVRGLDEETLKSTNFNPEEIRLLESYTLGRAEAEQFAQAAGLLARQLPYFKAAAPSAGTESANDSP